MATVRLTQRLQSDINYKLRQGFDLRLKQVYDSANKQLNPELFQPALREAFLRKHGTSDKELAAIPEEFLTYGRSMSLRSINDVTPPRMMMGVQFNKQFPHPVNANPYHGVVLNDPVLQPFADIYKSAAAQVDQIMAERRGAEVAVSNIFSQCSTLRQALELWPQMLDLCPVDVVRQHHAEPEKREKAALKIDPTALNTLNAAAVKNKLASVVSTEA